MFVCFSFCIVLSGFAAKELINCRAAFKEAVYSLSSLPASLYLSVSHPVISFKTWLSPLKKQTTLTQARGRVALQPRSSVSLTQYCRFHFIANSNYKVCHNEDSSVWEISVL